MVLALLLHVAVRQCSLIRSVDKVFYLKIQKKNVRSIKLSVRNLSLRTTATQSQGGVQGAVTLSMEDSGWATRKYYHPLIVIYNFSISNKSSQGNSNNLHRIIVDDFTDSMTYLLMVRS